MRNTIRRTAVGLFALGILLVPTVVSAQSPTLNQTINAGTLSTNIFQSDNSTPVSSPSVAFPATGRSFTCQTSSATLGDTNNRVSVTNMATNNGWTLSLAATGGAAATWTSGANTYKYNDAAGSGCTNGQLTIDASAATVNLNCSSACTSAAITKGASTPLVSGTTDSATLMTSSDGAAWSGYLTGVSLSQKIPASQAAGAYSLPMTITVTAN